MRKRDCCSRWQTLEAEEVACCRICLGPSVPVVACTFGSLFFLLSFLRRPESVGLAAGRLLDWALGLRRLGCHGKAGSPWSIGFRLDSPVELCIGEVWSHIVGEVVGLW